MATEAKVAKDTSKRDRIVKRIAHELQDGFYVNLGIGMPTLNPDKVAALERAGIGVVERVPCEVAPNGHAAKYLRTKREKLGHFLTILP